MPCLAVLCHVFSMHFIVKLFPEITIKGKAVRQRFTRQLRDNLRILTSSISPAPRIDSDWDKLQIRTNNSSLDSANAIADLLRRTPGIANFSRVVAFPLVDLDSILTRLLDLWCDKLTGRTFCVRVKRAGKHNFTSLEAEQFLGGGLLHRTRAAGVRLTDPEITVQLEIRDDWVYLVEEKANGLGGFPLGTQEPVLSLISGGFDSTVSSFLTTRRGLKTHFCFFNLGGNSHEIAVKEIAFYLWNRFGASHPVKFVTVPFAEVVAEILEKIPDPYMGVVLKRMMLRAATKIAQDMGVRALVTGESVAQVSSQTLPNLAVIDQSTDMLVMRPLIASDKSDIIRTARSIGTEEFAARVPEYCAVISRNPTTKARLDRVQAAERNFDFSLLDGAVARRATQPIMAVMDSSHPIRDIPVTSVTDTDTTIIDIRHPNERELNPLAVDGSEVLNLPFYQLNTILETLDRQRRYLLYCERGVMSRLQADELLSRGFENIGVYQKTAN